MTDASFSLSGDRFLTGAEKLSRLCRSQKPVWMGIVNLTPDSFSDGGAYCDENKALARSLELVRLGAHIIDFGGVSTRPGSLPVLPAEELRRVLAVVQRARDLLPRHILLSLDSFSPFVVRELASRGLIDLVNDVFAGRVVDSSQGEDLATTFQVAARFQLGFVLMHMQKEPLSMQISPAYDCLEDDVLSFFRERLSCAESQGVQSIVLDPGIGFGKDLNHNLQLISQGFLTKLFSFGKPVLVGLSRKSFLEKIDSSLKSPVQRDLLSKKFEFECLHKGVTIIRTHVLPAELSLPTKESAVLGLPVCMQPLDKLAPGFENFVSSQVSEGLPHPHPRTRVYRSEPRSWQILDVSSDEILRIILGKAKEIKRRPACVFDLDGTLFDVGYRTLGILKEWSESAMAKRFDQNLVKRVAQLDYTHIGYSLSHLFENGGFDLKNKEIMDLFLSVEDDWKRKFFDGKTLLKYDKVIGNAAEFLQHLRLQDIHVFYLTGRYSPRMQSGTYEQLGKHGFPVADCPLLMKENSRIDDSFFKSQKLNEIQQDFEVVANFENEYLNLAFMTFAAKQAVHVIVDSQHSGRPTPELEIPIYRIDYFDEIKIRSLDLKE